VCRYAGRIETISWSPRAFIYHNFLSREEVDHVVGLVEKLVRGGAAAAAATAAAAVAAAAAAAAAA
jgi:prolyl 4-hydroxylase